MILESGHSKKYLIDYRQGLIPMGKGIGCALDENLVWKDSQLNFILGHDNVGKSYFVLWYFLALATNHGQTFTLFMDENHAGKIFRDLMQMLCGKKFMELNGNEFSWSMAFCEAHFKIIDNRRRYDPNELLEIFDKSNTTNYLIDPFNGLKTPLQYGSNYDVLNEFKQFTKNKNQTIYINAHPATASGRRGSGMYPMEHMWKGHTMPPMRSDIEGGKPFANKADDFIICHRLTQHVDLWKYTMISVDKVKDTDTGGKPNILDQPTLLDYNYGLGFLVGGVDPINRKV